MLSLLFESDDERDDARKQIGAYDITAPRFAKSARAAEAFPWKRFSIALLQHHFVVNT